MRRRRITRPRWDRRCARTRGGDGGARTRHLRSARPTLSQLSYVPSGTNVDDARGSAVERTMVTRAGLEPAPPGLQPSARTRYATESRTTRRLRRRRVGVIGGIEPAPTRVTTERTDHRTTTEAATSGGSPQRDGSRARRPRPARETRTSSDVKNTPRGEAIERRTHVSRHGVALGDPRERRPRPTPRGGCEGGGARRYRTSGLCPDDFTGRLPDLRRALLGRRFFRGTFSNRETDLRTMSRERKRI